MATAGVRVACAGGGSRSQLRFDLVVATVDRTDDARARSSPRSRRRRTAPSAWSSSTRTTTTGSTRCSPRTPTLDVVHAALGARALARAERRAAARSRPTSSAFPDDDCTYPPDLLERVAARFAADPGLGGLSGRAAAATARPPAAGRPTRPARRATTVWHAAISSHDLPPPERRRARRGRSTRRSGSAPGRPGRRARRSTSSSARSARARGSSTTRRSSSRIPVKRVDARTSSSRSGGATARASATPRAGTRYPARAVARMLVRPRSARSSRSPCSTATRARFHAATLARPPPRATLGARRWGTSSAKIAAWRSSQSVEREPLDRRRARRRPRSARGRPARATTAAGERLAARRLVALEAVGVRDADARLVADELDRAAARRVHDRDAARHRLDHGRRARVVDLRVEQDVRAAEDVGRVGLRVAPEEARPRRRARGARASAPGRRRAGR